MQIIAPDLGAAEEHLRHLAEYAALAAQLADKLPTKLAEMTEAGKQRAVRLTATHQLVAGDPVAIDNLVRNAYARVYQRMSATAADQALERLSEFRTPDFVADLRSRMKADIPTDQDAENRRHAAEVAALAQLPVSRFQIRMAAIAGERGEAISDWLAERVQQHVAVNPDIRAAEAVDRPKPRRIPLWQQPAKPGDASSIDSPQAQLLG